MEEDTTNLDFLVQYTKCKRDAKLLYKIHIAILDEYLSLNSNWRQATVKAYLHIIIDYICFSPTVDPMDFEKYLISKFKLNLSQIEGQVNLTSNGLKYANCISNFMCWMYKDWVKDFSFYKYYQNKIYQKRCKPALAKEIVLKAFNELIDSRKYEDGVIIHTIFHLTILLSVILNIKINDVSDDGYLTYFSKNKNCLKTIKLVLELFLDLKFFIKYNNLYFQTTKKDYALKSKHKQRRANFILSKSYLSVFKSFERHFGNSLLWFDYTPSDIIELSLRLYPEGKANL